MALKIIGIIFLTLVIILAAYFVYLFVSYHRLPDHIELEVVAAKAWDEGAEASGETLADKEMAELDTEYSVMSYNVGFGAYGPDFTFFMDGGKQSWADSKEVAQSNIVNSAKLALSYNPDFIFIQEIDFDSTRTYHLDELELFRNEFADYSNVFAINYDSSFLFYPFNEPHGASRAGIGTFSKIAIDSAERRSFPITNSFSKFFDLDRCYSVSRLPVANGKELVLINLHMSAYGSNPAVREGQTSMLREEMEKEYAAGNYVIVGGDFNHDLKKMEDDETASWAHMYDRKLLPEHFAFAMDLLPDEEREGLRNSCRDSGVVYNPESSYTVTLDGFIISDNVEMTHYENISSGFAYSDHEPVLLSFKLK